MSVETRGSASPWRRAGALLAGAAGVLIACAAASASDGAAPGAGSAEADGPAAAAEIQGFSSSGAAAQTQLERRFDSGLSAADLRSWMQQMSSEPNPVGSVHDKANAEFQ